MGRDVEVSDEVACSAEDHPPTTAGRGMITGAATSKNLGSAWQKRRRAVMRQSSNFGGTLRQRRPRHAPCENGPIGGL